MGLEFVGIILAVEDTFGFSIPDEDVAGLDTVGKLYDYILAHRFRGYQEDCLSSITFYKLRLAIMSVLRIPRKKIRVSTKLSEIIPAHRRRTWKALQRETGLRLPQLRRPAWAATIAVLATFGLGIAVPVLLSLGPFSGAIIVAILTMIAVGYLFSWLTRPLAFKFLPECATMGQFTSLTLAHNFQAIAEESNCSASDAEVWETLQAAIAEELGNSPWQLTKETDFLQYSNAG